MAMQRRRSARRAGWLWPRRERLVGALGLLAAVSPGTRASATAAPAGARWTLARIVEAPRYSDVVLDEASQTALLLERSADLATNESRSILWKIDLTTGKLSRLLTARRLKQLRAVPGSNRMTLLADIGAGLQLYWLSATGKLRALVRQPGVILGTGPRSDFVTARDGQSRFGVINYGWSPDGRRLWYATARPSPFNQKPGLVDDLSFYAFGIRQPINELHVVSLADGSDQIVDRSVGDPEWQYGDAWVKWSADAQRLDFIHIVANADGTRSSDRGTFAVGTGKASVARQATFSYMLDGARGPWGGLLSLEPLGSGLVLSETTAKGAHSYGPVDFQLAFEGGQWHLPDGAVAIAVRHVALNRRSGLVRLSREGTVTDLDEATGLHDCAFPIGGETGTCIQEGVNLPPRLALIDRRRWRVSRSFGLAQAYEHIAPLRVEPRLWTDRNGIKSAGFLIYPRGYQQSKRYPAVLVTHGGDAEQRFVSDDFQWQFPIQALAEHGFIIICLNDPVSEQNPQMQQAQMEGRTAKGTLGPEAFQRWQWLEGVTAIKDVVAELDRSGLIDPERLGIAGYSRGSQMVNVAVSQTQAFRAASSGDGGYPEPGGYWLPGYAAATYRQIYGGSPYDDRFVAQYRAFAPSFRAALVRTAVLSQIATTVYGQAEFDAALKDAGVPRELVLFPRESHLFHIPSNRLLAMQQNSDWFDFWLRDIENPAMPEQNERWRKLRNMFERLPRPSHAVGVPGS